MLVDKFLKKLEESGIDLESIEVRKIEDATLVSFFDEIDDELLNISLIFYNDNNTIECLVSVDRENMSRVERLEKINELNKKYVNYNFFTEEEFISSKVSQETNGDVDTIFIVMHYSVQGLLKEIKY